MKQEVGVSDIMIEMETSDGYMLGVTFLKDGILTHHFLTNKFLVGDIATSLDEIKKLSKRHSLSGTIDIESGV